MTSSEIAAQQAITRYIKTVGHPRNLAVAAVYQNTAHQRRLMGLSSELYYAIARLLVEAHLDVAPKR